MSLIGTLAPAPSSTRALAGLSRPLSALEPLERRAIFALELPQSAPLCTANPHLTGPWRTDGRARSRTLARLSAR